MALVADPSGSKFPFRPELIPDIVSMNPERIFETMQGDVPVVIIFMEQCSDAVKDSVREVLLPFVQASQAATSVEFIFWVASGHGIAGGMRSMYGLGEASDAPGPQLVISDSNFMMEGCFVSDDSEVTAETIGRFLEGFRTNTLQRKAPVRPF